jgi:hypothetical protein
MARMLAWLLLEGGKREHLFEGSKNHHRAGL